MIRMANKTALILTLGLVALVFSQTTTDPKISEAEPFSYAAIEKTGTYDQHGDAFQTLYQQAGAQGLDMSQTPFGVYYNNMMEVAEEELRWDIGFKIGDDQELKSPLVKKNWDHTSIAELEYEGSFTAEEFGQAHGTLISFVEDNVYQISGPTTEYYLDMPSQDSQGNWVGKIRIVMPIKKK